MRHGELLSVKVVRLLHGDRFALLVKGREIAVRSTANLTQGLTVSVRAIWSGQTLTFRLEPSTQAVERQIAAHGLASDVATKNAVVALLRTGLAANVGSVRQIVRALRSVGRNDSFAARLVALVLDKNLHPSQSFVESLLGKFGSPFGRQHSRERGEYRHEPRDTPAEARGDSSAMQTLSSLSEAPLSQNAFIIDLPKLG